MVNKTLHSSSKDNLFWRNAALHFLDDKHHQKPNENFEELWTVVEVAELILTIARRFDWIVEPKLKEKGIRLSNLTNLDTNSIRTILEDVFPLLDETLSPEELSGNQIDKEKLEEHLVELDLLEKQLEGFDQAIQQGKPRIIKQKSFTSAQSAISRVEQNIVFDTVLTDLTEKLCRPAANTAVAKILADNFPPETAEIAGKISGLPEGKEKVDALKTFEKQLVGLLEKSQNQVSAELTTAVEILGKINTPVPVSTKPEVLVEWLDENTPGLPKNTAEALAEQLVSFYQQPAVESVTVNPEITRLIAVNLVQTAVNEIVAVGGRLSPETISVLINKTTQIASTNKTDWVDTVTQNIVDSAINIPKSDLSGLPDKLVGSLKEVPLSQVLLLSQKETPVIPIPAVDITKAIADIQTAVGPPITTGQRVEEKHLNAAVGILSALKDGGISVPVLEDQTEARAWVDSVTSPNVDIETKQAVAVTIVNIFNQPITNLPPVEPDVAKAVAARVASIITEVTGDRIAPTTVPVLIKRAETAIMTGSPDWIAGFTKTVSQSVPDISDSGRLNLSERITAKLRTETLGKTLESSSANKQEVVSGIVLTPTQITQGISGLVTAAHTNKITAEQITSTLATLIEKHIQVPLTANPEKLIEWFDINAPGTTGEVKKTITDTIAVLANQPTINSPFLRSPEIINTISSNLSPRVENYLKDAGISGATQSAAKITCAILEIPTDTKPNLSEEIRRLVALQTPELSQDTQTKLAQQITQEFLSPLSEVLTNTTVVVSETPGTVKQIMVTSLIDDYREQIKTSSLPENAALLLVNEIQNGMNLPDGLAKIMTSQPIPTSEITLITNSLTANNNLREIMAAVSKSPDTYGHRLPEIRETLMIAISEIDGVSLNPEQISHILDSLAPSQLPLPPKTGQQNTTSPLIPLLNQTQNYTSPLLAEIINRLPQTTPSDKKYFESLDREEKVTYMTEFRVRLRTKAAEIYNNKTELKSVENEIDNLFAPPLAIESTLQILDIISLPLGKRIKTEVVTSLPPTPPSFSEFLGKMPGEKPNTTALHDYLKIIQTEGTIPTAKTKLYKIKARAQAVWLLNQGINSQTIYSTQLTLLGDHKNASAIDEISHILQLMKEVEQKAPFELKKYLEERVTDRENEKRKGASNIQIPFSNNKIIIQEKIGANRNFLSVRLDDFIRRKFGERAIVAQNGRLFTVNRLQFINNQYLQLKQRLIELLSKRLVKTSIGRSVNNITLRITQSMSRLLVKHGSSIIRAREMWLIGQQTFKKTGEQLLSKGITKLGSLLRFGASRAASTAAGTAATAGGAAGGAAAGAAAGSVVPIIGTIIGAVVGIVAPLIIPTVKKIITFPLHFLNSITGGEETEKSYLLIFILVLGVPLFVTLLGGGDLFSAFTLQGQGSALPQGISQPFKDLKCTNNRHFSEEVICKLSQGSFPCDNNYIKTSTWPNVNSCITQNNFSQNKEAIRDRFSSSVSAFDNLQCVGFVQGIEQAFGRTLDSVSAAKEYVDKNMPQYKHVTNPTVGDLAVWKWGDYGHIAIIIDTNTLPNRIIVAEANGYNGEISLVAYPFYVLGGGGGSPDTILRPN